MAHAFSLIIDSVEVTGESLQAVALPGVIRRIVEGRTESRIMSFAS